ncbi:rho-like GTP binding protein [Trypanosoma rangeli SC58]|uniref:Rho-like GTP binding protein n=2 Tax=Trypanosoma rangeli TaxID=5698 RepID=A0A061IYW2_TRYRA|nr:rho-like GTP binding protein [Trypanosoma rangeli SC58]
MEPLHCKVILLGDGKVGKTCLQYSFANGLEYLARHRDYHRAAVENYELQLPINDRDGGADCPPALRLGLWDIVGQEDFERRRMCHLNSVAPDDEAGDCDEHAGVCEPKDSSPLLQCDVSAFILCFAWDDPHSLTNVQMRWYRELRRVQQAAAFLRNGSHCRPFSVVLCGTKFDLRVEADRRGITEGTVTWELARTVQQSINADALVVCSAKTGFGVRDVFHTAILLWLQNQPAYMKGLTPTPSREALAINDGDEVHHLPSKRRITKRSCRLL